MKKALFLFSCILLTVTILACSSPAIANEVKSNKARDTSPQVNITEASELVDGNSEFAFDLYQALKVKDKGNLIFSPYSLSLALAMAYAGARGDTKAQMSDTLKFSLPDYTLHETINFLALELAKREKVPDLQGKDEKGFRLNVVNDAWGQKDYKFLSSYLDTLAVNYGAGIKLVDFIKNAKAARKTINDYVQYKTEGRIKDLIPPGGVDELTRLVLTNAIYFNAAWVSQFDVKATLNEHFSLLDGTKVNASMMKQTEFYQYSSGSNYQVIELPYTGHQLSMVILLPRAGQFNAFEDALTSTGVDQIIEDLQSSYVELSLPKYEFNSDFGLSDILPPMGMNSAFDPNSADFSGITGRRELYITNVVHKAFISVDENGTEAAAASGVIMGTTSLPPEPVSFTADRPFIFLIRDIPTGTILFVGRVLNPNA